MAYDIIEQCAGKLPVMKLLLPQHVCLLYSLSQVS